MLDISCHLNGSFGADFDKDVLFSSSQLSDFVQGSNIGVADEFCSAPSQGTSRSLDLTRCASLVLDPSSGQGLGHDIRPGPNLVLDLRPGSNLAHDLHPSANVAHALRPSPNLALFASHGPILALDPCRGSNLALDPSCGPNLAFDPSRGPNLALDPSRGPNLALNPNRGPNLAPNPSRGPNLALDPSLVPDISHGSSLALNLDQNNVPSQGLSLAHQNNSDCSSHDNYTDLSGEDSHAGSEYGFHYDQEDQENFSPRQSSSADERRSQGGYNEFEEVQGIDGNNGMDGMDGLDGIGSHVAEDNNDDDDDEESRVDLDNQTVGNSVSDSSGEGNWLTYSELMLDSYPPKSKMIYMKAYKQFELYLKSNKQFVPNVAPTEIQVLNYFHFLKHEKNLAPTTLWSTYSRINACVKRLYGFSLKSFVRVSDVLKSYESGYKVKKASVFSPQEVNYQLK